jgi:signal transduction histidine kinase
MVLNTAESGQVLGEAEVALAEELARRAASAIENAELYRTAQQAIRERDVFLSMAAYELKTPLTSLKGFTQLLARQLKQGQLPSAHRLGH